MAKNSTSELISLLAHHINPEKDGQLKKTKTDNHMLFLYCSKQIDEKAAKLIKLIRARNQRKKGGGNVPLSEIIGLVENFHKEFLSLYALHDNLLEDLREKVCIREEYDEVEEEGSFTTYNAEDSFFSADEISIGSSPGHDHIRRGSDDFNLKPETPNAEIIYLRNKLISVTEEKEALNSEYITLLSKIQESEKIIEGLKIKAKEIESGKKKLFDEVLELKEKSSECDQKLVSLREEHEIRVSEVSAREHKLMKEKTDVQLQIEGKSKEAKQLGELNLKMQARIKELEKVSEEKKEQLSALMKNQNDLVLKIEKVNQELSDFRKQTVDLKEMLEKTAMDLRKSQEGKEIFERKVDLMISEKIQVEMQMEKKVKEAEQLKIDNEELQDKIIQLEKLETKRGDELSAIQSVLEGMENDSTVKIKSSEEEVKKLQEKMKLNMKIIERKIEDTAEGFYKKIEDNIRILSRRIRVAEQLHMENKDIYMKTKEKYEKEHEDFKDMAGTVKKMKSISFTASQILDKSETAAIKFNGQSENLLNRISKASCKVLFAKDWVRRKNNAIKVFEEDADVLLLEMGKKESEILGLRERVWKAENKVRELEKIVKEKDDGMLSVGEEKREAIRQLCVWIEYHRSRSDSLKKILSDITAARRQRIA